VGYCLGVQILDLPNNLHLKVKDFSFAVHAIYGTIVFQIAANGCLEYHEGMLVLQVTFAFRIQLRFRGGSTAVRHQNFKPWRRTQRQLPITILRVEKDPLQWVRRKTVMKKGAASTVKMQPRQQ
jgi:hypothetical protein